MLFNEFLHVGMYALTLWVARGSPTLSLSYLALQGTGWAQQSLP